MTELVRVSGARWPIERCFQEDKSELGLDPGWFQDLNERVEGIEEER
jgi:hypothetical protein